MPTTRLVPAVPPDGQHLSGRKPSLDSKWTPGRHLSGRCRGRFVTETDHWHSRSSFHHTYLFYAAGPAKRAGQKSQSQRQRHPSAIRSLLPTICSQSFGYFSVERQSFRHPSARLETPGCPGRSGLNNANLPVGRDPVFRQCSRASRF